MLVALLCGFWVLVCLFEFGLGVSGLLSVFGVGRFLVFWVLGGLDFGFVD